MLDKNGERDTIDSLNDELALSKGVQHLWKVYLRNGALIEFTAGWHAVDDNPSPATFLREFEEYQATGDLPRTYHTGKGRIYRFPKTSVGSILTVDMREVVAVQVEFKS